MIRRLLCFGLHRWEQRKWGAPRFDLDCRVCRRCGYFQIMGYGYWRSLPSGWDQADYEPTVLAEPTGATRPGDLRYRAVR